MIGPKASYRITLLSLTIALILSAFSFAEYCMDGCRESLAYQFFFIPLPLLGLVTFGTAIVLLLMRKIWWLQALLASCIGAELLLIYIQGTEIGHWCPLCLGVAAALFVAFAMTFTLERRDPMSRFTITLFLLTGLVIASLGIHSVEASPEDKAQELSNRIAFGQLDSPVEVYIFTDWFCNPCRSLEPTIEQMAPEIMREARLIFVDKVIHKESYNYVPYNLAFQANSKEQYLECRSMLTSLTYQTPFPSYEQVEEGAAAIGSDLQPLAYTDIMVGMQLFQGLSKRFKVRSTPTMVIVNSNSGEQETLTGGVAITQHALRVIRELKD